MKADIFVGILGERFGWIPKNYKVDDDVDGKFVWLKDMPKGCSMTELEMRGFLRNPENHKRAVFLFRDAKFNE